MEGLHSGLEIDLSRCHAGGYTTGHLQIARTCQGDAIPKTIVYAQDSL